MIFVDESTVKVGGVMLPGLFKSLEVRDDALVEEQEVQGSSRKAKQVIGYDDAKIVIELILGDGPELTRQEKLSQIQALFKRPGQPTPEPTEIFNEHTANRGITKVIFKNLTSKEDNKKEQITVSLEFWSYSAITITATKSSSQTGSSSTSTKSSSTAKSSTDWVGKFDNFDPAYQSYLSTSRGTFATGGGFGRSTRSPAQDTEDTSKFKQTLKGTKLKAVSQKKQSTTFGKGLKV